MDSLDSLDALLSDVAPALGAVRRKLDELWTDDPKRALVEQFLADCERQKQQHTAAAVGSSAPEQVEADLRVAVPSADGVPGEGSRAPSSPALPHPQPHCIIPNLPPRCRDAEG